MTRDHAWAIALALEQYLGRTEYGSILGLLAAVLKGIYKAAKNRIRKNPDTKGNV